MTDIIIDSYYPIGYFSNSTTTQISNGSRKFWASQEEYAPTAETLTLDFGSNRYINFLDLEISNKPIDISIQYDVNGTWTDIGYDSRIEAQNSVFYIPSTVNPWQYLEFHFNTVYTQKLLITFGRRLDQFPLSNTPYFPWSIEVKNVRGMRLVADIDDFIDDSGTLLTDSGTDLFGNPYTTSVVKYPVANILDNTATTFWQSQYNPSPLAVEALYLDLRDANEIGTMQYLDSLTMAELDALTMTKLDTLDSSSPVVINEIYIDPVTVGPIMHIYYSSDPTPGWDNKLWTPVPHHYVLKRGIHALPAPTTCKFLKLEFSNLTATPYETVEHPTMPPIRWRKYPAWVQNYFLNLFPVSIDPNGFIDPFDRVSIDPLSLFETLTDRMDHGFSTIAYNPDVVNQVTDELTDFIKSLNSSADIQSIEQIENNINFNSPVFWQADLSSILDYNRPTSRLILNNQIEDGLRWLSELPLQQLDTPDIQSVQDLTQARQEKQTPIMWFPRTCRHAYQIIESGRPRKIAYYVGIRDIQVYRHDYTALYDTPFIVENLDDIAHIELNEFVQNDWKYTVS